MNDFENFEFDDEEFAAGAGISKISLAYEKVFKNIAEIANEGAILAAGGSSKETARIVNKLASKVASLVELGGIDAKISGPNGIVYNPFGQEVDVDEDYDNEMSEEELAMKIESIIGANTKISIADAELENAKSKNIEDDGLSHGDLDEINW